MSPSTSSQSVARPVRACFERRDDLLGEITTTQHAIKGRDARLHAAIRDIAAHQTSARLLQQLRDQTVRHRFSLSLVPGRSMVSLPQHEAIVAAITARDPVAAEKAMHQHLHSVIKAFEALKAAATRA